MPSLVAPCATKTNVGMGQIEVGAAPCVLASVLGSCIGLTLYDPKTRLGAFAHIVLPLAEGRSGLPGKFADTAIPHMLEALERQGAARRRLQAKMCGGANMFGGGGPLQIGEVNIRTVAALLKAAGVPLVAQHVGGAQGRRARLETATGVVVIEIAGQKPVEI